MPQKSVWDLLTDLKSKGVSFSISAEEKVTASDEKGVLNNELKRFLVSNKAAVIDFVRQHESLGARVITSNGLSERYELLFPQRRLWLTEKLNGDIGALYSLPYAATLQGPLDLSALKQGLAALVQRHRSLRCSFDEMDGNVFCSISDVVDFEMPVVETTPDDLHYAISQVANRPFDLSKAPLFSFTIFKLAESHHVLLVNIHHIVADGFTLGILLRELSVIYCSRHSDVSANLAPMRIQYSDYIRWQNEWSSSANFRQQANYWTDKLMTIPPMLRLPTDRARPAVQSFKGASEKLTLPVDLQESLRQLSNGQGATMFSLLLAAYVTVLYRYSSERDFAVGVPVAGRGKPELENLVGLFVNTVALRQQLHPEQTFRQLVAQIRQDSIEAFERQDVPFEYLVEQINPDRSLSYSPIFQVMFVLQDDVARWIDIPGVNASEVSIKMPVSKFDLTMYCCEESNGLSVTLEYSTDIFSSDTARRLLGYFRTLLQDAELNLAKKLVEINLISPEERFRQVVQYNRTQVPFNDQQCVHEQFELCAAEHPEAIALISEGRSISYQELNEAANRLAHLLRERAVRPDALVGICFNQSEQLIIAILAVLKAGGAYVPLDPSYPASRLADIVNEAGLELAVTGSQHQSLLDVVVPKLVVVDSASVIAEVLQYPSTNISPGSIGLHAGCLVYVIFTSGSTGKPKGVMIEHRGAVNLYSWYGRTVLGENRRVLLISSFGFDLTQKNIMATLGLGKTLVLHNLESFDPQYLADFIAQKNIDLINCAPTAFFALVAQDRVNGLTKLKTVVLGGEAIDERALEAFFKIAPDCLVINSYGPTECTDVTLSHPISVTGDLGDGKVLGTGVPNMIHYVVDEFGGLCLQGAIGELHIGGIGLARGYINQPQLTEEKFINNMFDPQGGRLYKSGDLVRLRADGLLEYVGRKDHQVKIRGMRMELGEIECQLLNYPLIKEAAVLVHEAEGIGQSLAAFLVLERADAELSLEDLKQFLRAKLPSPMVPSRFKILNALPMSANGKLDRKALDHLCDSWVATVKPYIAPMTDLEKQVAAIWAGTLRVPVDTLSVHDSFFDLGGHSLLAAQVVFRIEDQLGVRVPLRSIFQGASISTLASLLKEFIDKRDEQLPIVPIVRDQQLQLSSAQQRLWFLNQFAGQRDTTYNITWAARLSGELNVTALGFAVDALVDRNESLRTTFIKHEGEPIQKIHAASSPSLQVRTVARRSIDEVLVDLASQNFDLAVGPLFQAMLLDFGDQDFILMLNMHHIISDGWSIKVILEEIARYYIDCVNHKPLDAQVQNCQYVEYTYWHASWMKSAAADAQLRYWKEKLDGHYDKDLLVDEKAPATAQEVAGIQYIELSSDARSRIDKFCAAEKISPFVLHLTLYKIVLRLYSQVDDILVGSPLVGRTRTEFERVVGFFVNTAVIRTTIHPTASFRDLVGAVQQNVLDAIENQDLPFDHLVRLLKPARAPGKNPFFQSMFTVALEGEQVLGLPGVPEQAMDISYDRKPMFDFGVDVKVSEQRVRVSAMFNRRRFSDGYVANILATYQSLAEIVFDAREIELLTNCLRPNKVPQ